MKIFLLIYFINLSFSILETPKRKEYNNDLGLDINKGTLLSDLKDMKTNVIKCLYKNGVNQESFVFCCGNNFINIEDIYHAKYREL